MTARGQAFWALVRAEVLRIFRQEDLYLSLLLPALFYAPVIVGGAAVAGTLSHHADQVVVLPNDFPRELDLPVALADSGFDVVYAADPRDLFDRGAVGAAVTGWQRGDGVDDSIVQAPTATPWLWRLDIVARDEGIEAQLHGAAYAASLDWIDTMSIATGGTTDDAIPLFIHTEPFPHPSTLSSGLAVGLLTTIAGLAGFQLLAMAGTADRSAGVMEALLVTPIRMIDLIAARIAASLTLQMLLVGILGANALALVNLLQSGNGLPGPGFVLAVLTATALQDVAYAAIGAVSANARTAGNLVGIPMVSLWVALGLGARFDVPAWVPVAGLAHCTGDPDLLVCAVGQGTAFVLSLAVMTRWSSRRTTALLGSPT